MDIQKFEWSRELMEALDIDYEKLPDLVPSGEVVGTLSPEASELTGFAAGTKLVSGAATNNAQESALGL
jgi:xylulokinase